MVPNSMKVKLLICGITLNGQRVEDQLVCDVEHRSNGVMTIKSFTKLPIEAKQNFKSLSVKVKRPNGADVYMNFEDVECFFFREKIIAKELAAWTYFFRFKHYCESEA